MKTPKEKAEELIYKYNFTSCMTDYQVKQCALIAVDEIVNEYTTLPHFGELYENNIDYYNEVKQEIENL